MVPFSVLLSLLSTIFVNEYYKVRQGKRPLLMFKMILDTDFLTGSSSGGTYSIFITDLALSCCHA